MIGVSTGVEVDEVASDSYTGLLHWLGFSLEQFVGRRRGQRIRERAMSRLIDQAKMRRSVAYCPLPRIESDRLTPEEFRAAYLVPNRPVVLEGFAKNWPAIRDWNLDFFRRAYCDYRIPVRLNASRVTDTDITGCMLTFSELVDRLEKGEDVYAQNLQGIFHDHPELRAGLGLHGVRDYLCRYSFSPITSTQLFISNQLGRTFYHCAPSVNLFTQIYGKKKWFMVAPKHSMWMHMVVRKDTFYLQSLIDWRDPASRQVELGYPLYNYIPKYEAVVGAGDAIFVPQWWWHGVENQGTSIGVSTHAFNGVFTGHKYMALLGLLNRTVWANLLDLLRAGSGTDESLAKRVGTLTGVSGKDQ